MFNCLSVRLSGNLSGNLFVFGQFDFGAHNIVSCVIVILKSQNCILHYKLFIESCTNCIQSG